MSENTNKNSATPDCGTDGKTIWCYCGKDKPCIEPKVHPLPTDLKNLCDVCGKEKCGGHVGTDKEGVAYSNCDLCHDGHTPIVASGHPVPDCDECQFEDKHSRGCSKFVEPKNPEDPAQEEGEGEKSEPEEWMSIEEAVAHVAYGNGLQNNPWTHQALKEVCAYLASREKKAREEERERCKDAVLNARVKKDIVATDDEARFYKKGVLDGAKACVDALNEPNH